MKFYLTFIQYYEIIETKIEYPPIIDDRVGKYSNVPYTSLHQTTFYIKKTKNVILKNEYDKDVVRYKYDVIKIEVEAKNISNAINFRKELLKGIQRFKSMVKFKNEQPRYSELGGRNVSDKIFNFQKPIYCGLVLQDNHYHIGQYKIPLRSQQEIEYLENVILFFEQQNIIEPKPELTKDLSYVEWSQVEFLDKRLRIKIETNYFYIPFEKSTVHHERMKLILFKYRKEGLIVKKGLFNYELTDSNIIENLITFFNLHLNLTNNFLNIPITNTLDLKFTNLRTHISSFFSKDLYVDKLINLHSTEFGIIPVYEPHNTNEELSYIFTIQKKQYVFLVWESICDDRATYIFKTTKANYINNCQTVYDYIKSNLRRKRIGIKDYELQLKEKGISLNYFQKILHTNYLGWEENFNKLDA